MLLNRGIICLALIPVFVVASLSPTAMGQKKIATNVNAAIVNGTAITQKAFDREMGRAQQQFMQMGKTPTAAEMSKIKKEILESLIGFELLFQESKIKGFKASEAELKQRMATLRKGFPDEKKYKEALLMVNLTEAELIDRYKQEMIVQQFIDKQFVQNIEVTDGNVKEYFDNNPDKFKKPQEIRVSHILIKVDGGEENSEKTAALKKIEGIQKKLKAGEDFADLAKRHSQCPSSVKGGDLDYFRKGQMVPPFEDAAFALESGEVSEIVETQFGYHLIKLVDRKPQSLPLFEEMKEKIKEFLKGKKLETQIKEHIDKMKEKAKIEIFIK